MQTFAVYVDNKPGVLNRVPSLIRRRAFNIESLTVGHTEMPGISRMTIVVDTDERGARLVEANLYKLIAVRRVDNITGGRPATRAITSCISSTSSAHGSWTSAPSHSSSKRPEPKTRSIACSKCCGP